MKILIINGPNLNMLGIRESHLYGTKSYQDLVEYLTNYAKKYQDELEIFQSNGEKEIIEKIQQAYFDRVKALIINPGAFGHYSYAIRDAITSVGIRCIEVHLTDIDHREPFRKTSVIRDICEQSFYGKGFISYQEALDYLHKNE
ncbi:MAG TPA: type II 3-dehydroquinate dehydratase [Bacilli bacterium]|nr:type II 3-dehydroquinate dehydratase [Bacilli bacterium]